MLVKDIVDEDFSNYKKSAMFIASCYCNFKCCTEVNIPISVCQNSEIANQPNIDIPMNEIYHRYISNSLTQSIVIGGLEPMLQFPELLELVDYFRSHQCDDDIVIFTGYYPEEIKYQTDILKQYKNIIIKYGRYKPNQSAHFDDVLGIKLISDNQFGEKIS